jgi:hypothetical protein
MAVHAELFAPAKTCTRCGENKALTEYHQQKTSRDGHDSACKSCRCAAAKKWRESNRSKEMHRESQRLWLLNNPDKAAAIKLRARLGKYSLTPDDYMAKLLAQGGRCGACGTDDPGTSYGVWCIDHDRSCCPGKFSCGSCIRELLCNGCNSALGHARDDAARLEALATYARRWRHA